MNYNIDENNFFETYETLYYEAKNGMIDLSSIQDELVVLYNRKELLSKHPYEIWQEKDGRYCTYLPDKEKGRLLRRRNTKEEVEDVVVEFWNTQSTNPTVREVFEEWNNRRLDIKEISKATHMRNAQCFNRHYKEMGKRRIKSIRENEWLDFLEEQIPKFDLTAKAFCGLKTITKGFLGRAQRLGLINFSVADMFNELHTSKVKFKKEIKEDYEEVFSEKETPVIMDYLSKNCDMLNSVILLLFVSGMRIGEAVALKCSDVHVKENSVSIRRTETRYMIEKGKYICEVKDSPKTMAGVRDIVIPANYAWLLDRILSFSSDGDYIFINKNGERIHTQTVRKRLERVCKKLNIYPKSPHKIRKTYGSILLDNNVDQRLVMEQMGHTDILCTENYYHRNRRSIEEKSSIISSLPDFDKAS